ncbi:hypothetical protein ACIHAX_35340 [Nocardia sp. NPDC051929]|uniref:hypothetical protein n=1 Tax=Nocardia sp. NPDC051929 TaxID=3364327 RepID=UPI0037C6B77A
MDNALPNRAIRAFGDRSSDTVNTLIADKGHDYPSIYIQLRQRRITGYTPAAAPATR